MMKTFSDRLIICAQKGDLTPMDLHRWFDRPYHTVRGWLYQGSQPRPSSTRKRKAALFRLELLEYAIKKKRGLPVPQELSEQERTQYVGELRDELEKSGFLAKGATA